MSTTIPANLLDHPIVGRQLDGAATLREALGDELRLLVFLRHMG